MDRKIDIEDSLSRAHVTKIDRQPDDKELTRLTSKLIAITVSIPTGNGGGLHGHVGMLMNNTKYIAFLTGGQQFIVPTNPGL